MSKLPKRLTVHFLSPNVTSVHQPADMGMIASLKVGYKVIMLRKLLDIFDVEGGYKAAYEKRKTMKRGKKGLLYGGKPHILDAMEIIDDIWAKDGKYAKEDGIQRCWRKSGILPEMWNDEINSDLGSLSKKAATLSKEYSYEKVLQNIGLI